MREQPPDADAYDAPEPNTGGPRRMMGAVQLRELAPDEVSRLAVLSSISRLLNVSYDMDDVLQRVLDVASNALGAERAFIMLDRGGDEPEIVASRGISADTLAGEAFHFSRSILQEVLVKGESVLSEDVAEDIRFAQSSSLRLQGVRSIMCVPMQVPGRRMGLLYVDNRISIGMFTDTDLELLKIIADLASAGIERATFFGHLVQTEKLAALGTFVAGIAHEINNPLTAISGLSQLIGERSRGETQEEIHEMADRIHQESTRCRNLVRELLVLSRREKAPQQRLPLGVLLQQVAAVVASDFEKRGVRFTAEIPTRLPALNVNPDQLTQVLLNLLTNGRQAVAGRPEPQVTLRALAGEAEVRIQVCDNGPGIPPEHLRQIFDPFFTTKPAGEGTGLGLSIAHRIILEHGGTISAHNDVKGGAVFSVRLPVPGV